MRYGQKAWMAFAVGLGRSRCVICSLYAVRRPDVDGLYGQSAVVVLWLDCLRAVVFAGALPKPRCGW